MSGVKHHKAHVLAALEPHGVVDVGLNLFDMGNRIGGAFLLRDGTRHAILCEFHPGWPDEMVAGMRERIEARA